MPDQDAPECYVTSRTAAETDDQCGMQYWWNFLESGTGIVPIEDAEALEVGRAIHEDIASVAEIPDKDLCPAGITQLVNPIIEALTPNDHLQVPRMEALYRRLGWLTAFALYLEPLLRQEFETVEVEQEGVLDRDPLFVAFTPDRVLRHREGHYLVYKEWKSTITAAPKWLHSWLYAIQIHIGLRGLEEELGEQIAYGQVVGFMKGEKRYDHLSHPYVWAWRNRETGKWTHDYNQARAAAWGPAPVWEYPGGLVQWVDQLGKEVGLAQFPHSPPVFLNNRMLEDWVDRRLHRERLIAEVKEDSQVDWTQRILYFEPRTRYCRPAWGDACPFLRACWNAEINQNPLASGLFKRRTPHHELEIIGVE